MDKTGYSMKPELTFFIPVRNGLPYIEECIASILAQTFQNWRLFILDNRSTDGTYESCSKYLVDERITYILNDTDIGMCGNFNKCLDLCDTKYYAILSHDDVYSCSRAVEDSFNILESDPDLCVVYSHVNWIDRGSNRIATRISRFTGKVSSDRIARESILSCRNLFGVPLLVRNTTSARGKRYDSDLNLTADVDVAIAIGHEQNIYIIDRPCFSIRFHTGNATARDDSEILAQMLKIAEKNGVTLGYLDRSKMALNNLKMRLQKFVFFMYLDHVRPHCASTNRK